MPARRYPIRFVPIAPVIPYLEHRRRDYLQALETEIGLPAVYEYLTGQNRNNFHRARKDGRLTLRMADTLACALGYHPSLIWGDAWWQDTGYFEEAVA